MRKETFILVLIAIFADFSVELVGCLH